MMPMPTEPMTAQAPHTVVFARELAHDLWQEAMPLFETHHREMPHPPHEALDVDVPAYLLAEERGLLRCYTARSSGQLIGYGIYFVFPHLWHRGQLYAGQHSLYLQPAHRKGSIGVRFIRFIERALRAEGVQVVRQHAHPGRREGALFERLGYELVHYEYEISLQG